jgi:hypothetical protein
MQVTHSDGEILDKIKKLFTYGRETKKIFAPINKNTLFLIRHSLIFYLFSYAYTTPPSKPNIHRGPLKPDYTRWTKLV